MRIPWRETMAFLVGAMLILFVAWALGLLPTTYIEYCYDNQSGHKECATYHIALVAIWKIGKALNWVSPAITAIATAFIGVFTWTLWQSTDKLWKSSEAATKNQLRAFVFARGIEQRINVFTDPRGQPFIKEYVFWATLENVGLTPATDVRVSISRQFLPTLENKEPHFEWRGEGIPVVIGPRGAGATGYCPIPIATMIGLWEWNTEIYIGIRIEYRDIFDPSTIHHDEQCAILELLRHPADIETVPNLPRVTFRHYGPQNTVA